MPSASHIRAVVFDLDDTLYPERQFVRSGYAAIGRRLGEMLHRDDPFEDWLWQRFLGGKTAGAVDALSEQFNLSLTPEQIVELIDLYRNHPPDITPFPGVTDLLETLRNRGVRLGVLTDGPARTQRNKLAALGLSGYFEAVIISAEQGPGMGKPDEAMYHTAAARLGAPHEQCAYVGDNLAKDFIGANRLGWTTVLYRRENQVHAANTALPGGEPDRVVHSDAELLAALGMA